MFSVKSNRAIMYIIMLSARVASQTVTDPLTNSVISTAATTIEYSTSKNKTTVLLPKCCPQGLSVGTGNCSQSTVIFQPMFNVYRHNETAFDDEPIDASLVTFQTYVKDPCKGQKFPLTPEEDPRFLANGSLLITGMGEYDGILGQDQFCIDNLNNAPDDEAVYTFLCAKEMEENLPGWIFSAYITFISISALLFASSAVFFYQQDVQEVHKKSFIGYATSMSATYLSIVLMQFISCGSKFFGLLLQFFLELSFCWIAVLCFDLAWSIHFYRQKKSLERTNIYLGSTTLTSILFLIISMCNSFIPDVPYSYFKPQFGRVNFEEFANQRTSLFFTVIILTIGISVLSLCYSLIKMNQNRYRNTDEGITQWRKVSKKYSYMYGRKLVVFITMLVLVFDAFSDRFPQNSSISIIILCVQAFHGFIIVPLYTLKTLRRVINVNNKPRIENLEELLGVDNNHVVTKVLK